VADLVANLDDTLFASVLANDSHVLHNLLPDRNECSYSPMLDFQHSVTVAVSRCRSSSRYSCRIRFRKNRVRTCSTYAVAAGACARQ